MAPTVKYNWVANPRSGFCAASDRVWISIDFSGQELMVAAAISKDPAMVRAFTEPEELELPDGTKYKNPYADLHANTAVKCCNPELFVGIPEHEWVELSSKNKSRKKGKITNFGIIYLQSAQSLSELNHVKLEETTKWVKGHEVEYAGYHHWAQEFGAIAASRGFSVSPISGLIRWVDEENSKGGGGESAIRAAVNASIQGESAQVTKQSLINLRKEFKGLDIKITSTIHDKFCCV